MRLCDLFQSLCLSPAMARGKILSCLEGGVLGEGRGRGEGGMAGFSPTGELMLKLA